MNEIHAKRREKLEQALVGAAGELFAHTDSSAFAVRVPGTTPTVYVVAGDVLTLRGILSPGATEAPPPRQPTLWPLVGALWTIPAFFFWLLFIR